MPALRCRNATCSLPPDYSAAIVKFAREVWSGDFCYGHLTTVVALQIPLLEAGQQLIVKKIGE